MAQLRLWSAFGNGLLDSGERDPLLFQANRPAVSVRGEVGVEGCLGSGEAVQGHRGWGWLCGPVIPVTQQGVTVHEHRAGMWQVVSQPVEDCDPCVSMSPQDTTWRSASHPGGSSTGTAYPPPKTTIAAALTGNAR